MKAQKRNKGDKTSKLIYDALAPQFDGVKVYRYNSVSVRVRVIDPSFEGKDRVEREEAVRPHIKNLPKEVRADITVLLLLTEDELSSSLMNYEFEHPSMSTL